MKPRVAFIGLGTMGYHMAGHLARAGHETTVHNRSAARMDAWLADFPGRGAPTPAQAAAGAEFVFACVGNDEDLREITLDDHGAFAGMAAGTVFVDHTTASAQVARELAALAGERQIEFIDAPVSGGEIGARKGSLTVMAGGRREAFERCRDAIRSYSAAVTLMGASGTGQLTKMVNQVCVAGVLQGLSEGLNLAIRSGLDTDRVLDVISRGAAQSWQMENRGRTMVSDQFDFGFAVDWMRKDLDICLSQAHDVGASLPVTAMINEFYAQLQALGGGRWDTSSLIRLLRNQ